MMAIMQEFKKFKMNGRLVTTAQVPWDPVDRVIETQAFNFVSLVSAKHLINGLLLICCLYGEG